MIHEIGRRAAPCGCHAAAPSATRTPGRRLGFVDVSSQQADPAAGVMQCDKDGNCYQDGVLVSTPATGSTAAASSWQWLLIAALAALVVFQSIDSRPQQGRRKR